MCYKFPSVLIAVMPLMSLMTGIDVIAITVKVAVMAIMAIVAVMTIMAVMVVMVIIPFLTTWSCVNDQYRNSAPPVKLEKASKRFKDWCSDQLF